ncbi:rho guanine nucleotide exchange factor 10-like [Nilaparvata lugens]|uniref:rho guanine nucleotide exchange factor 10-like n=1 Tax=Nilaparvata lugens TaxID=108931 RepID=UPI00193D9D29|nr:rho guanine nucleotide exchange factor 10-like [Nilaparvata lugens]
MSSPSPVPETSRGVYGAPPPRRPYLRFPPPPPYPPGPTDYAYAYYEPGPSTSKHTFITRYGTEENIYEEIGASQLEEEVRYVHSRHLQVLDELNLTVEAMLMPEANNSPPSSSTPSPHLDHHPLANTSVGGSSSSSRTGAFCTSGPGGPNGDDLLSPSCTATCSLDSGFSGSSTGTNSLTRSSQHLARGSPTPKARSAFWKKLPGLGSSSTNVNVAGSKHTDEPHCTSWEECAHEQTINRSSGSDQELSSGDESLKSGDRYKPRSALWRRASPDPLAQPSTPQPPGRLSRWFSIRRGSQSDDSKSGSTSKMPLLPEVEEETGLTHRRLAAPSLPPAPHNLSAQELKRRHIVAAIVQSENNYLASLHRLVYDYKKALEDHTPQILSASKISTIFHRLPEILQCHTLFRIALAEAVANWDRDHRIGDVFVASFSKAIVLDIYRVPAPQSKRGKLLQLQLSELSLLDCFQQRQNNSPDRLSLFALMVKAVQRFPQFILLLQDLLHHTGHGHPDRMSLQLALTQLESLAELLNERKREAEQSQAFKEMLRAISGKLAARPIADNNRYLLRQDDVVQMEVNQCGLISKCKNRRLLLLNDLLVCVTVNHKDGGGGSSEHNNPSRLQLKWSCPIAEVHVIDLSNASPTLSRLLAAPHTTGSLNSNFINFLGKKYYQTQRKGLPTNKSHANLFLPAFTCQVLSRIADLASTLKGCYEDVSVERTRAVLNWIQGEIQQKDEQMAWVDSCCLQITIKGKDDILTFQMESPEVRKEWVTELRLARLALDPTNSPAWEVPEQERHPSTKMPLYVGAHPLYTLPPQATDDITAGCYYTASCGQASFLWVCTSNGHTSHISIAQVNSTVLKPLTQLPPLDAKVTCMEYVRSTDTVWLGTDNQRILVYCVSDGDHSDADNTVPVEGGVVAIRQHCDTVFVAMTTGRLLLYRRGNVHQEPEQIVLSDAGEPVACLLPINLCMYVACGKTVTVLSAITGEKQKNFTIQHEHVGGNISLMAHSGVGLWLSLSQSSTICLYHTETFKHLQDINVASNVIRLTGAPTPICVTALMACKGLLWVGTDVGVSLTVPLPRLEGVPIISGRVNVSYHGHTGPVKLMLALQDPPTVHKRPPSKALACDVYGLYGQLMYVKDYEDADQRSEVSSRWSLSAASDEGSLTSKVNQNGADLGGPASGGANPARKDQTLVTITGGKGYVNLQQPCCTTITNNAHIILWEMKL